LETAVKAEILNFVLPTEKRGNSFILDIFQISWQLQRIRKKPKPPKNFVDAGVIGVSSEVKLDNPLFCSNLDGKFFGSYHACTIRQGLLVTVVYINKYILCFNIFFVRFMSVKTTTSLQICLAYFRDTPSNGKHEQVQQVGYTVPVHINTLSVI